MPEEPTTLSLLSRLRASLGPGLIVAATAIGSSHIILSPVAGARFGYSLLWLVLVSHLFKYPAFEFGPRYAVAMGESLVDGYSRVPGPRNWAVWVFLFTTTLQGLTIVAGVLSVTASILLVLTGVGSLPLWIVVLGAALVVLLVAGGYGALATGSKLALVVLALVSVVAFVAAPPSARELSFLFVPSIPSGSAILAASILGLMPTGINVAIWHSLWAVEHLPKWKQVHPDKIGILRLSMTDLKIGYWMSAGLAIVFMSLGANLLRPRGLTPAGVEVVVTLSKIYTEVLGEWMFPVFMTAAFAALFSTSYSVLDGFPRAFSSLVRRLFPDSGFLSASWNPAYWLFLGVILGVAVTVNTVFPNPVQLVTFVGVVSLLVAPILYGLNYYCATRVISDPTLRPGAGLRVWALTGLLLMTAAACFAVYMRLR